MAEQDYPSIEYIIIDGGSTDGTLGVIEENAGRIDQWVSEPDSGIAEAMNKGLARATGDLILYLHSDDRFTDGGALSRAMSQVTGLDRIWAFGVRYGAEQRAPTLYPRPFNLWTRFKTPLLHQGVLFPRALMQALGGFDTSLRIAMDYEYWMRAHVSGISVHRVRQVLTVMGDQGLGSATDWESLRERFREERLVQHRYCPNMAWTCLYEIYWPVYLAYRKSRAVLAARGGAESLNRGRLRAAGTGESERE